MLTEELARKLCEKEIAVRREFAEKAEALCEVVRKFDGKVLNKRLETAMWEVYPVRISHDKDWGWVDLSGYIEDRMVQSDIPDKYGSRAVAYLKNDRVYIFSCKKDVIDAENRIIAERWCEEIMAEAQRLTDGAQKLEEQLKHLDEISAEARRIDAERRKWKMETRYEIQDYFGIEV